jgi:hypothetical protein
MQLIVAAVVGIVRNAVVRRPEEVLLEAAWGH